MLPEKSQDQNKNRYIKHDMHNSRNHDTQLTTCRRDATHETPFLRFVPKGLENGDKIIQIPFQIITVLCIWLTL